MIYGIYIKMVIYYRRFWAWFYTLNLFLSPLPSLTLFLFLQLHPQNHFTCGSNVEEIIHRTGCSIGTQIPCNGKNYKPIQKLEYPIKESIRISYPSSYSTIRMRKRKSFRIYFIINRRLSTVTTNGITNMVICKANFL